MPKLVDIVVSHGLSTDFRSCFACAREGVDVVGTNKCFYDDSVGSFATEREPWICDGHKNLVRGMNREQRRLFFKGQPLLRARFNRHTSDEICGVAVIIGGRDLACLRAYDHGETPHEHSIIKAAELDGVRVCCRVATGADHAPWCDDLVPN